MKHINESGLLFYRCISKLTYGMENVKSTSASGPPNRTNRNLDSDFIMINTYAFNQAESKHYHEQGYAGPFQAFTQGQMKAYREELDRTLLIGNASQQAKHWDTPILMEFATCKQILDRVASLLGNDIALLQTFIFVKNPGEKEIPWHQDVNYWAIEPPVVVSAWLAIDDVDTDNACVDIIPGSHRKIIPHIRATDEQQETFTEQADPNFFDSSQRVRMRLKPGEFFLFTERMLHHSDALPTRRRAGIALRYTIPFVRNLNEKPMIIVRGEDRFGFNRYDQPSN